MKLHKLHRERNHARQRVDYCRKELQRFEGYADPAKEQDRVMLCRLGRDLRIAEMDAGHASLQLEDAPKAERLAS